MKTFIKLTTAFLLCSTLLLNGCHRVSPDSNQRKIKKVTEKCIYSSKETNTVEKKYDTNGNIVFEKVTGEDGKIISQHINEYDEQNNLIKVEWYNGENLESITEYKYDSKNNIIYISDNNLQDKTLEIEKREYIYDNNENILQKKVLRADGTLIYRVNLKYDSKNNAISKEYLNPSDEKYIDHKFENEYSADGKLVSRKTYDGMEDPKSLITIKNYNSKGDTGSIYKKMADSSDLYLSEKYDYDENGNLIKLTEFSEDGTVVKSDRFSYNNYGERIEWKSFIKDEELSFSEFTQYEYF